MPPSTASLSWTRTVLDGIEDGSLDEACLGTNDITDDRLYVISEAVGSADFTVRTIFLEGNTIGDRGAQYLAKAAKRSVSLEEIYLNDNRIGRYGATALADLLRENTNLAALSLSGNQVEDDGATELAEGLKRNFSLRKLYLNCNGITDYGGNALAAALRKNKSLSILDIYGNKFSARCQGNIEEAVRSHPRLELVVPIRLDAVPGKMRQEKIENNEDALDILAQEERIAEADASCSDGRSSPLGTNLGTGGADSSVESGGEYQAVGSCEVNGDDVGNACWNEDSSWFDNKDGGSDPLAGASADPFSVSLTEQSDRSPADSGVVHLNSGNHDEGADVQDWPPEQEWSDDECPEDAVAQTIDGGLEDPDDDWKGPLTRTSPVRVHSPGTGSPVLKAVDSSFFKGLNSDIHRAMSEDIKIIKAQGKAFSLGDNDSEPIHNRLRKDSNLSDHSTDVHIHPAGERVMLSSKKPSVSSLISVGSTESLQQLENCQDMHEKNLLNNISHGSDDVGNATAVSSSGKLMSRPSWAGEPTSPSKSHEKTMQRLVVDLEEFKIIRRALPAEAVVSVVDNQTVQVLLPAAPSPGSRQASESKKGERSPAKKSTNRSPTKDERPPAVASSVRQGQHRRATSSSTGLTHPDTNGDEIRHRRSPSAPSSVSFRREVDNGRPEQSRTRSPQNQKETAPRSILRQDSASSSVTGKPSPRLQSRQSSLLSQRSSSSPAPATNHRQGSTLSNRSNAPSAPSRQSSRQSSQGGTKQDQGHNQMRRSYTDDSIHESEKGEPSMDEILAQYGTPWGEDQPSSDSSENYDQYYPEETGRGDALARQSSSSTIRKTRTGRSSQGRSTSIESKGSEHTVAKPRSVASVGTDANVVPVSRPSERRPRLSSGGTSVGMSTSDLVATASVMSSTRNLLGDDDTHLQSVDLNAPATKEELMEAEIALNIAKRVADHLHSEMNAERDEVGEGEREGSPEKARRKKRSVFQKIVHPPFVPGKHHRERSPSDSTSAAPSSPSKRKAGEKNTTSTGRPLSYPPVADVRVRSKTMSKLDRRAKSGSPPSSLSFAESAVDNQYTEAPSLVRGASKTLSSGITFTDLIMTAKSLKEGDSDEEIRHHGLNRSTTSISSPRPRPHSPESTSSFTPSMQSTDSRSRSTTLGGRAVGKFKKLLKNKRPSMLGGRKSTSPSPSRSGSTLFL